MDTKLFFQAIFKFFLGLVIVGVLLFLSAGSFYYYNAWLFIGLLFIPMFIVGIIMMFKSPDLLRSRLNAREKEKDQREVVAITALMFIVGFIISGLNYRFDMYKLPNYIVIIASIIFIVSYIIYAEVLRENAFLSRAIEVKKNQKVIDTGLYSIVRHPMYFATVFLFLSIPLILRSIVSFLLFLYYPFIIAKRIKNEEEVLEKSLKGYKQYKKKVKYKLIPYIW